MLQSALTCSRFHRASENTYLDARWPVDTIVQLVVLGSLLAAGNLKIHTVDVLEGYREPFESGRLHLEVLRDGEAVLYLVKVGLNSRKSVAFSIMLVIPQCL
jgi:hypothetical protein